ncbi:hypothetical protein [Streptomyces sp. NBC_01408]|uniref:hypothetical protein n=1 Tax=Streptomyces sp. NBC_01408 TaxID=2903855 RepID=UPI002258B7E9|nr:hypothetical protein [Streptomyces sp. NBC_01408]MCX4696449.1 hypothetical protein [Streptomyces sp. NBC_01408]
MYWQGTRPYRVPLPTGWTRGSVRSVNSKGLMAGTLTRDDRKYVLFTYEKGARAVRILTAPADPAGGTGGIAVNDAGRVAWVTGTVAKEWQGGRLVRELPLPVGAQGGTRIDKISGINKRGDIVGSAYRWKEQDGRPNILYQSYPVVWPAGSGPAYALPGVDENNPARETHPAGIDDRGVVAAAEISSWHGSLDAVGYVWQTPYTAPATALPGLAGQEELELADLSPTTNRLVGTAMTFLDGGYAKPSQATYQTGRGPVKVLPVPDPASDARATAVADDDRVAGQINGAAVIWTCADQQATLPEN